MAREPSLAAFYGPASAAALVACLYFLSTLVQMKRHPGRRYELKELAEERQHVTGETPQGVPPVAVENEHSFRAQLLGASLTLLLSALLWAAAALSVSQDTPLDLCFSCLFGVLALATGTSLLLHHCGYREDVRRLWASACCSRRRDDSGQVMFSAANGSPPLVPAGNTGSLSTNGSASSARNSSQECKLTNLQAEVVQRKPLPLPSNGTAALLDCSLTEHSLDNEIQMHVAPIESSSRVDWRSGRLQRSRTRAQRLGRLEALRGYAYDVPTSVDGSEQRGPCGSRQAYGGHFQSRSQGHLDSSDTSTPLPRRCRSVDRQWSSLGASIGASVPSVGTSLASSIGASVPSMGTSLASSIGDSGLSVAVSMPAREASSTSTASSCPGEGEAAGGFESNTNMNDIKQSMEDGGQSGSHGPNLANQNGSVMDNGRDGLLLTADNPTNMKISKWKHETTV